MAEEKQSSVVQVCNASGLIKSSWDWANGQFDDNASQSMSEAQGVESCSAYPGRFLCELGLLGFEEDGAETNGCGSVVRGAGHGCIV